MNVFVSRGDPSTGLLSRAMVSAAIRDSLAKLNPRVQFRNPVTLGVYLGSIFTTIMGVTLAFGATDGMRRAEFVLAVAAWLWLSVLLTRIACVVAMSCWSKRATSFRPTAP